MRNPLCTGFHVDSNFYLVRKLAHYRELYTSQEPVTLKLLLINNSLYPLYPGPIIIVNVYAKLMQILSEG